jgi:hypothetical protein
MSRCILRVCFFSHVRQQHRRENSGPTHVGGNLRLISPRPSFGAIPTYSHTAETNISQIFVWRNASAPMTIPGNEFSREVLPIHEADTSAAAIGSRLHDEGLCQFSLWKAHWKACLQQIPSVGDPGLGFLHGQYGVFPALKLPPLPPLWPTP